MAQYPWGAQTPSKRVASVEKQIAAVEKKKKAATDAHASKMAEFDVTEKALKADLRQAQNVLDREEKDQVKAAASKSFEKVLDKLISDGVDIEKAIENGDLMKAMRELADPGAGDKKAPAKQKKSGSEPAGDS